MELRGSAERLEAVRAVATLMTKLRFDYAFVGGVAAGWWLDEPLGDEGAIDVLAAVPPDRAGPLTMMARNHGFRIDEAEVQAAEELDLVPMSWGAPRSWRVHMLFASNALYGRMVRDAAAASLGEGEIRVVAAEDLALLLLLSGEGERVARLRERRGPAFDTARLNAKLVSIGLGGRVLA